MKPKDKQYIVENITKKSIKEIAKDLGIKERKIKKFLDKKDKTGAITPIFSKKLSGISKTKASYYKIIILSLIFITALVVRLYPVINSPEKFKNGLGPFGDTHLYHRIAYNLYKGKGFSGADDGRAFGLIQKRDDLKYEPAIARGPVYPFFMYVVYKYLGSSDDMESIENWHKNWDKIRVVQCILDATICFLVFFIVRFIYPISFLPALISAFLYCFSFYNIFYTKALLSESINTFLITSLILFCVLGLKRQEKYWWLLAGICFSLTVLSRPEYVLFLFISPVYIFFVNRQTSQIAIKKSMIFFISAIIVIAPWTLRNYLVFKRPIIVSTGGIGYNSFLGTFETNKNWIRWGVFPDEIFANDQEKTMIMSLYDSFNYYMIDGTIRVNEYDQSFMKLAINRIRDNPVKCFKTWIIKIPRLWYQFYIPMYAYREASGGFFIFYFIFALYAFCSSGKKEKKLMAPICLLFIYLTLLFLPLHIEPRYGVTLMPGIISLTGIGFYKTLSWLKT